MKDSFQIMLLGGCEQAAFSALISLLYIQAYATDDESKDILRETLPSDD